MSKQDMIVINAKYEGNVYKAIFEPIGVKDAYEHQNIDPRKFFRAINEALFEVLEEIFWDIVNPDDNYDVWSHYVNSRLYVDATIHDMFCMIDDHAQDFETDTVDIEKDLDFSEVIADGHPFFY